MDMLNLNLREIFISKISKSITKILIYKLHNLRARKEWELKVPIHGQDLRPSGLRKLFLDIFFSCDIYDFFLFDGFLGDFTG